MADVARIPAASDVRYAVIGAMAVAVHGAVRVALVGDQGVFELID